MKRAMELFAVVSICTLTACAHAPTRPGERADLVSDARKTLMRMESKDPGLQALLNDSAGYVIFPRVGNAGFLVGGGAGTGVVYEHGHRTGFATIEHAGVGAIAGGERYAELIVIKDPEALDRMKAGHFDFGANASAVILRTGASATASFDGGVAVFVEPIRGAMVNAAITGQRIRVSM